LLQEGLAKQDLASPTKNNPKGSQGPGGIIPDQGWLCLFGGSRTGEDRSELQGFSKPLVGVTTIRKRENVPFA